MTERALVDVTVGMHNKSRIVGTSRNACLAPGALVGIDEHNIRVVPMMARTGWTKRYARRVGTVVAAFRTKLGFQIRVGTTGRLDYPVPVKTRRNLVLGLAGNHAVSTADARLRIDHHGVSSHR
jgi:hypothetical protein